MLCSLSAKYDVHAANKLFSNALKTNNNSVHIGTAFHLAELCNVRPRPAEKPWQDTPTGTLGTPGAPYPARPIVQVVCEVRAFRGNQCHALPYQFQQFLLLPLFCPVIPYCLFQRVTERFSRHPFESFCPFPGLVGIRQPPVRPDLFRGGVGIPVFPVFQFLYGKIIAKRLGLKNL